MTNHSEAAGMPGDSDISGRGRHGEGSVGRAPSGRGGRGEHAGHDLPGEHQVTLRTPAELADALPYLLGYRPEDSIVLVALHDGERRGRFGGRARLGIPAHADDWPSVADQLAQGLVKGSERRGARPESMVAYLCQEPGPGESGRDVMERLRPLAQLLRTACGRLDVPVVEALCISDGRFWSYCCPGKGCCSSEGQSMGLPGTSVLAAAATYAGLQVRGSLREFTARFIPWEGAAADEQQAALDTASMALVPRILDAEGRAEVAEETLGLARQIRKRFADAPPVSGTRPADLRDDGLLEHDEAADLILGLQDRTTRDRAAEWMEGDEAGPALRLWRALARRCVGPYGEHAAAPSPSPDGSPGRPVTNWRPAKPWPWHSAPIPTTSSPAFCTRRATRASTRSRSAAVCARSAPAGRERQRNSHRFLIVRRRAMPPSRRAPRTVAVAGHARRGSGDRAEVGVTPGRLASPGVDPPMRPRPAGGTGPRARGGGRAGTGPPQGWSAGRGGGDVSVRSGADRRRSGRVTHEVPWAPDVTPLDAAPRARPRGTGGRRARDPQGRPLGTHRTGTSRPWHALPTVPPPFGRHARPRA